MYARVVRATVADGGMDRSLEGIKSTTIPSLKAVPGVKGGYWFANRESGRVIGTVFFESQEALAQSRDAAERIRSGAMAESGAQLAGVEEYEVIVDTGQKVSTTAQFGRLTFTKGDPGNAEAAVEQIKGRIKPAIEGLDGFAGGVWMLDRASGDGISITLWNTKDALQKSGEQVASLRDDVVQSIGSRLVGVEECEIGARAETT